VVFAFHTALTPSLELPGLTLITLPVEMGTAKYDVVFDLQEVDSGVLGCVEYNTDLFQIPDAMRMITLYEQLLRFMAATPEKRLSALLQSLADWETSRRRAVEETQKSEDNRRKLRNSKRKAIVDVRQ
jgi:non-ribosomal peptide synthetase component F